MAIDPICGMTVDETTALSAERDGQTYYFCCEHCRQKFLGTQTLVQLGPGRHDNAPQPHHPPSSKQPGRATYICPMHPEVEQDEPGTCPKCGMALEPKTVEPGVKEDDSELRSMTLRFWVALVLTA